ncbi:WD40/YVTN/BNR-like repeat-containing protein [Psychrobacter sanguinis]|uniref:WD40/YVTN/BNR-like repeat-containing protein n=1 Tax=Psychrobacter sanguinis TaxID=861445 RepID=UPI00191A99FC|nr:hypothetical protein [Psychrobacter sanguinis]MCC3344843.1 hypothetical protein [Psychrobacter sanguinis]
MADENIKQVMQDAILDADSLERFINGSDSETVLTRLSAEYPTLKKAIKELFKNGGLPATPFATKALMMASALVDGNYAMVTDDTVNNGLYVKTAGAWVKSGYDPLTQAKAYADVYPDVATGRAAVAVGEQFQVAEADYIVRYRKDSETIVTEVARLPLIATPQRSTFMEKTKNLFEGDYYPWFVSGSPGTTALLYNTDPSRRTAVAPIVAGLTYTVRIHDTEKSNAFRIATHTKIPSFNTNGIANLTKLFVYNDALKQATFVADVTGFVFVTVSNDGAEPRLQIEEGTEPTEYVGPYVLGDDFLPASVLNASAIADEALELASKPVSLSRTDFSESTRNLFGGEYQEFAVTGSFPSSALLYKNRPDYRTAILPIEAGETYTVKVHGESGAFRLAVNPDIPTFQGVEVMRLASFLAYNDILKEFTFTAGITGYAFLTVSNSSQEPLLQFEKGDVATPYVPPHIIKTDVVVDTINNNSMVVGATTLSQNTRARLDDRLLFPKAVNTEMTPTDPGPRFIEYFDDNMWGYNFLTGQIMYSEDEGRTWLVKTTKTFQGAVHRLLPTADGEVLAMTSNGVFKSSGWSDGAITWSDTKVEKHANATLFQFSFDGNGTKFIIAEYAASVPNWPDSRFVWISTDMGETFDVVWDSLAEHGEEVNSLTHLHGACYDKFSDRFYFTEGHAPGGGLYCSVDDGATWVQGHGMRDGVLASTGIVPMEGDTNGPTVIVATPTGLVMGSDNRNNGMFGLIRQDNPLEEVVTWTYQIDVQPTGVAMFAIRGWLDEASGTAYIAFRSERNDVPPRIFAANASEAGLVYQYPNLPVVGAQDHYGAIAKIGDDRLVAYAQFGGRPYTFRADLQYPSTEVHAIVRLELKKLGII